MTELSDNNLFTADDIDAFLEWHSTRSGDTPFANENPTSTQVIDVPVFVTVTVPVIVIVPVPVIVNVTYPCG